MEAKTLLISLFILTSHYCLSQNFNEKENKKFHSLKIDLNKIDLNNQENISNLNLILRKDKFRRINKTLGITLAIHSLVSTVLGIALVSDRKGDPEGMASGIGSVMLVGSAISGGFSIPLLIVSSKRKKERDELLKLF